MSFLDVASNLSEVLEIIENAKRNRKDETTIQPVRLVAVSKTKPKELIIAAYKAGQRFFGENYIQELAEKANDVQVVKECPDIKWHFIGRIQRKKIIKLLSSPHLDVVETIDTLAHAILVDQVWRKLNGGVKKLKVFLQVNTSGEQEKSGCRPDEVVDLAVDISTKCSTLILMGLMTIGKYDNYDTQIGINPDFVCLKKCRKDVSQRLEKPEESLELSMGMSGDYEHAIEVGSSNVRVGQKIFGPRDYSKMEKYKSDEK